jgi:hypothetical protein
MTKRRGPQRGESSHKGKGVTKETAVIKERAVTKGSAFFTEVTALSLVTALSFLSSRLPRRAVGAKPRDLQFYGPFLETCLLTQPGKGSFGCTIRIR